MPHFSGSTEDRLPRQSDAGRDRQVVLSAAPGDAVRTDFTSSPLNSVAVLLVFGYSRRQVTSVTAGLPLVLSHSGIRLDDSQFHPPRTEYLLHTVLVCCTPMLPLATLDGGKLDAVSIFSIGLLDRPLMTPFSPTPCPPVPDFWHVHGHGTS